MTKDEALKLALEALENAWLDASMGKGDVYRHNQAITAIKEALEQPAQEPTIGDIRALKHRIHELEGEVIGYKQILDAQPEERNFCQRCGKRTADLTTIHTCTPPQENT